MTTIADVRAALQAGPPTMDVRPTAALLGIAASSLYESIKRGDAPVQTIRVGTRIKVLTSSVIGLLGGAAVRTGETPGDTRSSKGMPHAVTTSPVKCAEQGP